MIEQKPKGFSLSNRQIFPKTSYCAIMYFHYTVQNFGTMSNVRGFYNQDAFKVKTGIIKEEIASVRVQKNIAQPSGTFEIRLHPTKNWKGILSPGDWLGIYFFNSPSKDPDIDEFLQTNLVMLGNVDRIARSLEKDKDTDKVKLDYVISGRNFGKAFEETDIWFDPYAIQQSTEDTKLRNAGLPISGSPDEMVKIILKIFLGPGAAVFGGKTLPLFQWRISEDLSHLFSGVPSVPGKSLIYDIIDQRIKGPLPGYKLNNMLTLESNGSVWDSLKRGSNELVNELFLEEVRDPAIKKVTPTITLRPRPFQTPYFEAVSKFSQFGKFDSKLRPKLMNGYTTMQKHAAKEFIEIDPTEIIYENIGRDEHSRFNMWWMTMTNRFEKMLTHTSNLNTKASIGNPIMVNESIHRHGLKRFDQMLEFCYAKGDKGAPMLGAQTNLELFQAFMVQLYDMHYANHLYEAGTIECSGVLEAELGKCLKVQCDPEKKRPPKIYYIEGYEHVWKFPSTWRTTFTLTHGQFLDLSKEIKIFIDSAADDFGQPDVDLQQTYLAKTTVKKQ